MPKEEEVDLEASKGQRQKRRREAQRRKELEVALLGAESFQEEQVETSDWQMVEDSEAFVA